jgi:hypothetical protein
MHIDGVPNRTSRPTYLLRESYRVGKKVRKRTLANLSTLSDEQIEAIRAVLSGQTVRPVEELLQATQSRSHGAVQAVRVAMQRLGFEALIASRSSPERDAVCAMVAARVLAPHTTSLGSRRSRARRSELSWKAVNCNSGCSMNAISLSSPIRSSRASA